MMLALNLFASLGLITLTLAGHIGPKPSYVEWKTFKGLGVNLGGWLVQEPAIDTTFFAQYGGDATDEWTFCANLGSQCGPVLETRYASWITTADIDKLASVSVNVLRIPTTYAAWIKVPGSQLYSGNQVSWLRKIANYAIWKYGMHIIIDIHSLPGGINGLTTGEATGHWGWFDNQTALDYSYQVVEGVIDYIQHSGSPQSYTLEPLNEAVTNHSIESLGSPWALSDNGAAWVLQYIRGVLSRVEAVNPNIPTMFQGSWLSEEYWAANFTGTENLVFDAHNYYFAGPPTDSDNVTANICADAKRVAGDGKFPVFVGEWAIQTTNDNNFANRRKNLNAGLYAWNKYEQGSCYWTAKFTGNTSVEGEGTQADYWDFEKFIDLGYVNPAQGAAYCD